MTVVEIFNSVTNGGANDFAEVVGLLKASGSPWCLIGGLGVNAYVEPTLTLDADFVVATEAIPTLIDELRRRGYRIKEYRFWINVQKPSSDLLIQFTTDVRYQAAPDDLIRSKVWAYTDPERRPAKRFKDAADIANLVEAFPGYLTWIVERSFAWLGRNRRLSRDYEYQVQTSETMIDLAAIRLMINRIAPV
jgi:transposase